MKSQKQVLRREKVFRKTLSKMTTKKKTPLLHQASKEHSRWLRSSTFILVPEKDPAEKAIQQIDEEIVTTKEDQTLSDEEKTEKIEGLQAKRKALSEQRHAFMRDAEGVFNEQHQKGNDEAQADIGQKLVKGIWTSADDVYRNRDAISSDLEARVKGNVAQLPLQVTDFELSTLRVEIFGERQELSPEAILELAQSLQRAGQFDEDFYLASYADVASAVAGGHFKDGKEHFKTFGDNEGRSGWFSGERYDFDEVYYLSENPDIAVAIVQGQYRSGAHHFWSTGRAQGLKKNEGNNELLRAINLDGPEIKPEELTTQTRQTTDGDFTLGFRSRGSRVENHLEGLFSGDIYPDAYLDIHDAANKMDPESRRAVKGATKPLVNLAKVLEKTAGEATKDSEVIPTFIKDSEAVADGLADIADQIGPSHLCRANSKG